MAPAPRFTPDEEQEIVLDAAVACIEESSLLGFTIGAIAKRAGLSVGSLYKHVQSKEDLLVALATRLSRHTRQLYGEILGSDLSSPQRIIALSLLNPEKTRLFNFDEHLNTLVCSEAILRRASSQWLAQMREAAESIDQMFAEFFHAAADSGELSVKDEGELSTLSMGCWSMCAGFQHIALMRHVRGSEQQEGLLKYPLEPDDYPIVCTQRLLNTYQWQAPLTRIGIAKACAALVAMGYR
ncbi:MAG TPA: TetR/AcrR family transcriptional regulator [Spongiibacteraceae bacterium]|jgi:AcrR family transcriptional regulator|nr:TetR family transcriptional regulator [Spongiibacteraceae bacterium]HCS25856.1 TetR/AcrR family transcriptional regulator [Spongiibacteraceae bacterium]